MSDATSNIYEKLAQVEPLGGHIDDSMNALLEELKMAENAAENNNAIAMAVNVGVAVEEARKLRKLLDAVITK